MPDIVLPESDTTTHSWSTSHGQYVTGIFAAASNNGIGISGAIGTHVRLIYHKVQNVDDIVAAIGKMAARGVAVVNMSLGVNQPCVTVDSSSYGKCQVPIANNGAIAAAITKAMHDSNVTFVISAGNNDMSVPRVAAQNDGLIVVGAMNEAGRRASYTNYGSGVSIFAPDFGVWGLTFDDYTSESPATSFTTPLVAGGAAWAALYLTAHGVKYTPKDVKSLLLKSIQPQSQLSGYAEVAGSLDYLNLAQRLQTFVLNPKLLNKKRRKTE
jgi:serine protease